MEIIELKQDRPAILGWAIDPIDLLRFDLVSNRAVT
jgi:hypothetical protein